jgi:hypothetical protein
MPDVTIDFKVHALFTLPSPRAGESEAAEQRGERDQGWIKGEGRCANS